MREEVPFPTSETFDVFAESDRFNDDPPPMQEKVENEPLDFGGFDDMMGDVTPEPLPEEPKQNHPQSLDEMMGGLSMEDQKKKEAEAALHDDKISNNPAITPEFNQLKELYKTSSVPSNPPPMADPMGMG